MAESDLSKSITNLVKAVDKMLRDIRKDGKAMLNALDELNKMRQEGKEDEADKGKGQD